jgi:hypothetical protein
LQAADVNNIALLLQPMGLGKDGDNNLVWCSDAHFETQVNTMDSCVSKFLIVFVTSLNHSCSQILPWKIILMAFP